MGKKGSFNTELNAELILLSIFLFQLPYFLNMQFILTLSSNLSLQLEEN